ncbi:MAG: hypothetical protein IJ618_07905 [Prevotella sp.]|nr:hypothetical protein [Prevotella sp.]
MKKVFTYMTIFAAIAMMTLVTSCKNSDKDPNDVANGILAKDWQGYLEDQKESGSSWKEMDRTKVTIHFEKTAASPFQGIGYQLELEDDGSVKDKNKFTWTISSDRINIDYETWTDVFIEFNHDVFQVDANQFRGEMYDGKQHRYLFDLKPTPAVDWTKYFSK